MNKVRMFRDIDELKIWGNENGMRFLRDPDDKTKYKVYFSDDDVDKLESFVRQLQDEIAELKVGKIKAYNNGYEDGRKPDTNPRQLTHEDLVECIDGHIPLGLIEDYGWVPIYEFAKAILRKAQRNEHSD